MGEMSLFAGFVGFVLLEHLGAFMRGAHDFQTIATLLGFPMVIVLVLMQKNIAQPAKGRAGYASWNRGTGVPQPVECRWRRQRSGEHGETSAGESPGKPAASWQLRPGGCHQRLGCSGGRSTAEGKSCCQRPAKIQAIQTAVPMSSRCDPHQRAIDRRP